MNISFKDIVVILIPVESLLLAYTTLSSLPWTIIKLMFAIPSLVFIPGYSVLINIFKIKRFGYEEYIYSSAISISTIILSGYIMDTLKIPLPYQIFILIACIVTLIPYTYTFLLNYIRGKNIGESK